MSAAVQHLVTGGAGFTGRVLVQRLHEKGEPVVVFDHAPRPTDLPAGVTYIQGNITNAADISRLPLGRDTITYHLAARQFHLDVPKRGRDAWFAEVNVEGTRLLLEAMRAKQANRLVFISTDMVYGLPQQTPVAPDHQLAPLGPYGRSKVAAEKLITQYRTEHGLHATIFRPRLIAGPGRLGVLVKLFKLIEHNLPVIMIGTGTNRYQMISVFDIVSAIEAAVEQGLPPGPLNLGSANPPLVKDLLQDMIKAVGSRSPLMPIPAWLIKPVLRLLDRAGYPLLYPEQFEIADIDCQLDDTQTRHELQWQPSHGDNAMMMDAYRFYQKRNGAAGQD